MLRKLLRCSTTAARLQSQAQASGLARCSLVHTNACEQMADAAVGGEKNDSRSLLSACSRAGVREAVPSASSGAAPARTATPALPSLLKPSVGVLGATAKHLEAYVPSLLAFAMNC